MPGPTSNNLEAHSGASIAQSAIERKQKMKTEPTPIGAFYPAQHFETPRGNDGKKYRNNLISKCRSEFAEIELIKIMIFSFG